MSDTYLDDLDFDADEGPATPRPGSFEEFVASKGLDETELIHREGDDTWDRLYSEWEGEQDRSAEQERKDREAAEAKAVAQARQAPTRRELDGLRSRVAELDEEIGRLKPSTGPQSGADGAKWTQLMEERQLAAFRAEELEVELPFVGVNDEALAGIIEDREIASEEDQERLRDARAKWGQSGVPSARLRKIEREAQESFAALYQARCAQQQRRDLAAYQRANEALVEKKVATAIEGYKSSERFKAQQEFDAERRAGRMSDWDVKVEMELFNRRLESIPADQLAQLQKKARAEIEAEHDKILRKHIVRGG
jgi:hypothetical protein